MISKVQIMNRKDRSQRVLPSKLATVGMTALAVGLAGKAVAEYPEKPVTFIVRGPPATLRMC
jgi:hypothetical protein